MKRLVALALALLPTLALAQDHTEPVNALPAITPDASSYPRTREFLRDEDADRFREMLFQSFVVSGGLHGTAAGRTASPSTLIAYPGGWRITETGATAITYQDDATCWVIATRDATGNVSGFTRVTGSHFAVQCGVTDQPTLPSNSVYLMKVETASGAIISVTDLRVLSPIGGTSGGTTTNSSSCGAFVDGDPTGITDSYNAIQSAISTCASSLPGAEGPQTASTGCTVCFPEPGRYLTTQTIVVPSLVSLQGNGVTTLYTNVDNLDKVVSITESWATDNPGNRYGAIRDIWIDCDLKARVGWYLGKSVERHYENLGASECKYAGFLLDGAQNNLLESINAEKNGLVGANQNCTAHDGSTFECAAGIRLQNGAGNNKILRCEDNENTPRQLVIWDDGSSVGGFAAGPSGNKIECNFERPQTGALEQIYIRSGRYNVIRDSDISATGMASPLTLVRFTQEDRAAYPASTLNNGHNRILGGALLGTSGQTTAIKVEATGGFGIRVRVKDALIENHLCGFNVDNASFGRLNIGEDNSFGGVTQRYCGAAAVDTAVSTFEAPFKLRVTRETAGQLAMQSDVGGQICTTNGDCSTCSTNTDCGGLGVCSASHCTNGPICFLGTCGDANPRYKLYADGTQEWGQGNASPSILQRPYNSGVDGLSESGPHRAALYEAPCQDAANGTAPPGQMSIYCDAGLIPKVSVSGSPGIPLGGTNSIQALPGTTVGCIPAFATTNGNQVALSGLCSDGSGNLTTTGDLTVDHIVTTSHAATDDNNIEMTANVGSPSCAVKGEDGKYKILFNADGTGLVCFGTTEVAHLVTFGPNTTMPTCDANHVGLSAYDGDGTKGPCVCTESSTWRPIVTNTTNADCG